jgi:hypothetical protein
MTKMTMASAVAAIVCFSGSNAGAQGAKTDSIRPAVVKIGAHLEESTSRLKPLCTKLDARQIKPAFLVLREFVKVRQMQLDCDGFQFAGGPRWAEFIFADDSLAMVWILTEARDEADLLRQMTKAYGAPTHRNEKFIAFAEFGAALRTDRPEVLFFAPDLKRNILPWFGTPSTFR